MLGKYILCGTEPVIEPDILKWAQWFETADSRVALTQITSDLEVSTVFLGIDHNFFGYGALLLFETMVFRSGKAYGDIQERYATWHEAEQGHEKIVQHIRTLCERGDA